MENLKKCFECNGDGWRDIEYFDIYNVRHLLEGVPCPVCLGTCCLSLTEIIDYNKEHKRCVEFDDLERYGDPDLSSFDEGVDFDQNT